MADGTVKTTVLAEDLGALEQAARVLGRRGVVQLLALADEERALRVSAAAGGCTDAVVAARLRREAAALVAAARRLDPDGVGIEREF